MWPLEPASRHYLRIGRHAVERWVGQAARLECVAVHALAPGSHDTARTGGWPELEAALRAMCAGKPKSGVTLLLESALMPVLLVETGPELWKPAQMHKLLRHRLDALFAEPGKPAEAWDTRIDFRAGEAAALGFGLRPALKAALVQACAAAALDVRQLLPALAWGVRRLDLARRVPEQRCWLGWAEQDRMLLARIEKGRTTSLNAAATLATDSEALLRQVQVEHIRRGLPRDGQLLATRWSATQAPGLVKLASIADAVSWIDIGRAGMAPAAAGGAVAGRWAEQA